MISERLIWYLESSTLITNCESGFGKIRSTLDRLGKFEAFIWEGFVKKEHVASVLFELEKAYDTIWKHGIKRVLHELGLRGRFPNFKGTSLVVEVFALGWVQPYLTYLTRNRVSAREAFVIRFITKINSIANCIKPGTDCFLLVYDFNICYRSKSHNTIEGQLQQHLKIIQSLADENGFKFSPTKTFCVHFSQLRCVHFDPELYINGGKIPVAEKTKFLGLYFDSKLIFLSY